MAACVAASASNRAPPDGAEVHYPQGVTCYEKAARG
jgi:hypothetical protein